MALSPLHSSVAGVGRSASMGDSKSLPFSTNYPNLFAPLQTKAAAWFYFALVLGYTLDHYQPFGLRYLKMLLLRLFPILGKVRFNYKYFLATAILGLLTNQEIQLDRSLITDFRFLTNGFWSSVDNIVLHYIQCKSTKMSAVKLHLFHGFGANALSFQPIIKLFGLNKVNAVGHDNPGFGYNPRIREVSEDISYPGIFRPLWNARASLAIQSERLKDYSERNKIVLMGHSMGCICAMAAAGSVLYERNYRENTDDRNNFQADVTLVLIDPAFAFSRDEKNSALTSTTQIAKNPTDEKMTSLHNGKNVTFLDSSLVNLEKVANGVKNSQLNLTKTKLGMRKKFMNVIPIIFKSVLMKIIGFLKRILKIPVQIILRRLVHWDLFWYQSLQYTWGKKIPQVKPGDVFRYKLASMAKGFDNDFLSFVSAQNISPKKKTDLVFTGAEEDVILSKNVKKVVSQSESDGNIKEERHSEVGGGYMSSTMVSNVTQLDLLVSLVDLGCKVIIVHGTNDPIVPYQSSQNMVNLVNNKLLKNINADGSPRSIKLVPVPGAGHMPHEENPEKFLQDLQDNGVNFL